MKLWKQTVALMLATLLGTLVLVGGLGLYIIGERNSYQCSFYLCQTDQRQRFHAGTILGFCKICPDDRGGTAFLQGVSVPSLLWGGIYSDR